MWLIILILLFNPIILFANTIMDSLKFEASKVSGIKKYEFYQEIFNESINISSDSALCYCREKLEIAETLRDSSLIAKSILDFSFVMELKGKSNEAIRKTKEALKYYEIKGDTLGMALCLLYLATYYYNSSQFNHSHYYALKALNYFKESRNVFGMVSSYQSLCLLHISLANYNKSLEYNYKALSNLSNEKNTWLLANNHFQMAEIMFELKNYNQALENYYESLKLSNAISYIFGIAVTSNGLAKLFNSISLIDSSLTYANKALNIYEKIDYKLGISFVLSNIGNIYKSMHDYNLSKSYYQNALKIAKEQNHSWLQADIFLNMGELYLKQGEYQQGHNYLQKSIKLAQEIGSKDLVKNNYLSLSHYYQQTGNYIKALEFHHKYTDLKDSLFLNIQNDITDLQVSYHIEREQREKELLQKNNEIYKLEIEKQKLYKSRFFLLFIIVTLISVFIYLLYRQKKRLNQLLQQKVNEAFAKHCEQQQIISHQAGLTSLGELAAGIAHEINQPVQNIILCVENIEMENVENSKQNKEIHKNVLEIYGLIDRIRYILEHIRLFSSRQREEYCETFNINKSINDAYNMVRKQFSKHGIKVKLELKDNLPLVIGNSFKYEQVVLNLLLNSRDALTEKDQLVNSEYQKEIILKSYPKGKHVYMEVWDNGVGIPEEHKSKIFLPFHTTKKFGEGQGLGLSISYGIIKEMGGQIDIDCLRTGWTLATIMVPVYDKIELLQAS